MGEFELNQAFLGLREPWKVTHLIQDSNHQQGSVIVDADPGPYRCPECQARGPGYDRKPRRWWRFGYLPVYELD